MNRLTLIAQVDEYIDGWTFCMRVPGPSDAWADLVAGVSGTVKRSVRVGPRSEPSTGWNWASPAPSSAYVFSAPSLAVAKWYVFA
jgi:hypothetical protein